MERTRVMDPFAVEAEMVLKIMDYNSCPWGTLLIALGC